MGGRITFVEPDPLVILMSHQVGNASAMLLGIALAIFVTFMFAWPER